MNGKRSSRVNEIMGSLWDNKRCSFGWQNQTENKFIKYELRFLERILRFFRRCQDASFRVFFEIYTLRIAKQSRGEFQSIARMNNTTGLLSHMFQLIHRNRYIYSTDALQNQRNFKGRESVI